MAGRSDIDGVHVFVFEQPLLTNNLGAAGVEGDWEMIDAVSPVMTEGARKWIRDLASQFHAAGINASFAFSMECRIPPAAMRVKYLSCSANLVSPGGCGPRRSLSPDAFGTRVRMYRMYKECAASPPPFGPCDLALLVFSPSLRRRRRNTD